MIKCWSRALLPLMVAVLLPTFGMTQISLDVSVNFPPPELPIYDQPPIPGDGYVWTPGYWAWGDEDQDYYWVPGTWVPAPQPDYLWTPGYWGSDGVVFLWHSGYWGPHVGFYGGVNYGYGYGGNGYEGGYWQGGRMYYNRSVNNINDVHITNVYNKTVINNVTVNRISYNGGNGIQARPTGAQLAVSRERHIDPTPIQRQHVDLARHDESLRASQNQGRPPIAATRRPTAFTGAGVVPARQGGTFSVVRPNTAPQNTAPRQMQDTQREPPRYQNQPRNDVQPRNEPPPRTEPPRYQNQPRNEPPPRYDAPRAQPQQQRPVQQPTEPRREAQPPAESRRAEPPPQQQRQQQQQQPQPQPRPSPPPPQAPRPAQAPRPNEQRAERPPEHQDHEHR